MEYLVSANTDVGITKDTNQDSVLVKQMRVNGENIVLAVLCDGMGGLEKGELASASIVYAFDQWVASDLQNLVQSGLTAEKLRIQWERVLSDMSCKIMEYGKSQGVSLGSTVVAILLTDTEYYVVNVGDSRAYEITDELHLLTEDQTLVEREVKQGNITPDQAKIDPRRNILLQCVGATEIVYPDMFAGKTKKNAVYMLCSDGFRHEITEQEIAEAFSTRLLTDESIMQRQAIQMIELNKNRQETDNITVALIRTY